MTEDAIATAVATDLPQPVAELVDALAAMRGSVAVVLGGSRALGAADAASDWDLGVYYRGAIDLTAHHLGRRGRRVTAVGRRPVDRVAARRAAGELDGHPRRAAGGLDLDLPDQRRGAARAELTGDRRITGAGRRRGRSGALQRVLSPCARRVSISVSRCVRRRVALGGSKRHEPEAPAQKCLFGIPLRSSDHQFGNDGACGG